MRFHPVATNFPAGLKSAVQEKSTSNGLYPPIMTTVERDRIDDRIAQNGGIIYNEDVENLQFRVNNAWIEAGGVNTVGAPVVIDNIPMFANNAGTLLADSGFNVGSFVAAPPESLFSIPEGSFGLLAAPEVVTVHGIGNLGYIQFINDSGLIFVDSLVGMQFIENNFGSDSQVCTLIASGLPSTSTSVSALLELKSTTGAFLNARMTTTQRDALINPQGGMMIYNTTTNAMNYYQNGAWGSDAGGTVTSIIAGTGLTGGTITTTGTIGLANTAVTPGTYTGPITVGADGRLTAASTDTTLVRNTNTAIQYNIAYFQDNTGKNIGDTGIPFDFLYWAAHPTYIFDTANTTTYNMYIGTDTGGQTINGSTDNVGLGYQVFKAIGLGTANVGLGKQVFRNLTTGSYNVGVGWLAGFNITTGSYNLLFGDQAGYNLTSGGLNSVFGHNALFNATTASSNQAFGNQALYNATSANNCFAAGLQAMFGATSATHCIAIGQNALNSMDTQSHNIGLGYQAGFGGNNYTDAIFIGRQSAASSNNLSNIVAIGAGSTVQNSNNIILGAGCKVGIGTSAAQYALHLSNDNSMTPEIFMASAGTGNTPGNSTSGLFAVNGGRPAYRSGTLQYTGGIVVANSSSVTAPTIGTSTTNGITGRTISTTAFLSGVLGTSRVFVSHDMGTAAVGTLASRGTLIVAAGADLTSFTVYSTNAADVGFSFSWHIINTAL